MGNRLFTHTAAAVANRHHRVLPWNYRKVVGRIVRIEVDFRSFDCQRSAERHCVARIHNQVHYDLLNLSEVSSNGAKRSSGFEVKCNVFAQHGNKHFI